jgi:hypothetical protein
MSTDKFLVPVVEGVVALLDIKGTNSRPLQGDVVLAQSAKTALSLIETHIGRKLAKSSHDEIYDYISTEISIRNTPIDVNSDITITDLDTGDDITSDDFSIHGNKVIRLSKYIASLSDNKSYRLQYTGGMTSITDDNDILQALVQQTIAVYKRRDSLGISTYSGGDITSISSSDRGSLMQGVRDILTYRIYYGAAR